MVSILTFSLHTLYVWIIAQGYSTTSAFSVRNLIQVRICTRSPENCFSNIHHQPSRLTLSVCMWTQIFCTNNKLTLLSDKSVHVPYHVRICEVIACVSANLCLMRRIQAMLHSILCTRLLLRLRGAYESMTSESLRSIRLQTISTRTTDYAIPLHPVRHQSVGLGKLFVKSEAPRRV